MTLDELRAFIAAGEAYDVEFKGEERQALNDYGFDRNSRLHGEQERNEIGIYIDWG